MSTPRSTLLAAIIPIAAALGVLNATTDTRLLSIAAAQTSAHKLSVAIENGKANTGTVRVTQGEEVEITVSCDQSAELHMHGYDLSVEPRPGTPATFAFVAKIAGRFPVEAHRMGPAGKEKRRPGALFYVEVHPR
jgi:FtsP/CotA-like multicopper oxidase with cupredoxin domain